MEKVTTKVQKEVQTAIDEMVESGTERGMQVAVYHQGTMVVDAVAGLAEAATGRKVTSDTPFYCFSVMKAGASTVAHMLAERGLFTYDTPVVDLWPEFGAHSKEKVTVRHVLNHSAGVPGLPLGTKIGCHAYSFGYIVGEIIRRATGKPISQVLLEEVSGPLGMDRELYFGMPASEHHRLARLADAPMG